MNEARLAWLILSCAWPLLGMAPALARGGNPPLLSEHGHWTYFCDNTGGCGLANTSMHRGSDAARSEVASPWACLWLGASDKDEASLSILLEKWQARREDAVPQEVVVQPVKGTSEAPVGHPMAARWDGDSRYGIAAVDMPALLAGLRMADAALVREVNGGPVIGRIGLDGFTRMLNSAVAFRTEARSIPVIEPKPFERLDRDRQGTFADLHRRHCGEDRRTAVAITIYRLGWRQELWTMPCRHSGFYNFKTLAMIITAGGKPTELVLTSRIDYEGIGPDLSNLGVNPAAGTIQDYHKTRGAGDCGIRRQWAWNGRRFVLASEHVMIQCFGAAHSQWLRLHTSVQPNDKAPRRPPC